MCTAKKSCLKCQGLLNVPCDIKIKHSTCVWRVGCQPQFITSLNWIVRKWASLNHNLPQGCKKRFSSGGQIFILLHRTSLKGGRENHMTSLWHHMVDRWVGQPRCQNPSPSSQSHLRKGGVWAELSPLERTSMFKSVHSLLSVQGERGTASKCFVAILGAVLHLQQLV